MDMVIEGLDKQEELPVKIYSQGGRYAWDDQAETPNVQSAQYEYADGVRLFASTRHQRGCSNYFTVNAAVTRR